MQCSEAGESERDESTKEQLQCNEQYKCTPHGTLSPLSPAMAMKHESMPETPCDMRYANSLTPSPTVAMKVLAIAGVEELLRTEPVPEYAYNRTFEKAFDEPFCVLHTSGSTGHPKPIVTFHACYIGCHSSTA